MLRTGMTLERSRRSEEVGSRGASSCEITKSVCMFEPVQAAAARKSCLWVGNISLDSQGESYQRPVTNLSMYNAAILTTSKFYLRAYHPDFATSAIWLLTAGLHSFLG